MHLGLTPIPRFRAGTFIEAQAVPVCVNDLLSGFPRLRVGTFIEAKQRIGSGGKRAAFPRLRAGTFIEAQRTMPRERFCQAISPPSGRDFH